MLELQNQSQRSIASKWLMVGCVTLLLSGAGGCRSPLGTVYSVATGKTTANDVLPQQPTPPLTAGAPVTQANFAPSMNGDPAGTAAAMSPANTHAVGRNPLPEPTREEAFAAVLSDLQQIGMESPAAQQELLRQLQAADPGHWDLIVRRFRSTLAYSQQLNQQPGTQQQNMTPPTAIASRPAQPNAPSSMASYQPPPAALPTQQPNSTTVAPNSATPISPTRVMPRGTSDGGPVRLPSTTPPAQSLPAQTPPTLKPLPAVTLPADSSARNANHLQPMKPGPANRVQLASAETNVATGGSQPQPQVISNPYSNSQSSSLKAPSDWRAHLAAAIANLEATSSTEPVSTGEAYSHAKLRLMRLASGELDGAVTPIPGLTPTEQDYWSSQMFALSTMLDHEAQPEAKRRAAAAEIHLTRAQSELKQLATLGVRNLTFCDQVDAYGAYQPSLSRRFKPGEEVTLYLEVENFSSSEKSDGFHTVIGSSYRVLDARGTRVDGREYPALEDICLSPRRDFFIQYGVTLPERIYPGEYQLELTLTDQIGSKIGRASIDFEIVDSGQ